MWKGQKRQVHALHRQRADRGKRRRLEGDPPDECANLVDDYFGPEELEESQGSEDSKEVELELEPESELMSEPFTP